MILAEQKSSIKKFLIEKSGISENGLVGLVCLYTSGVLNEEGQIRA